MRVMRAGVPLVLAMFGALIPAPAAAHTKSTTYSVWRVEGATVHLVFTVPVVESQRLAAVGEAQPSNEQLGAYIRQHLSVSAGKAACAMSAPPKALSASTQFRRFEAQFRCPADTHLILHDTAFFELVPSHVNLAQVELADGRYVEQLFTASDQRIATQQAGGEMRDAGFLRYVQMGIMHIFTGVDHMSFLLGLVLISRRLRDLVYVVTGFTIGHSATLALAVTGIIRPHAEYIDALVALTIAMIGAENVAVATHRPGVIALGVGGALLVMAAGSALGLGGLPPLLLLGAALFSANYFMLSGHLRDAARLRLVVTLVFGLIHGFGFAADLLELHLPSGQLFSILLGFNLGVEVGQLSLVFVLLGAVWLLVRGKLALPRPIVVDGISAGLVALGVFWFVSRSYA